MKSKVLGLLSLAAACLAAASTLAAEPAQTSASSAKATTLNLAPPTLRPDDPDSATTLLYQKPKKDATRGMASVGEGCVENSSKPSESSCSVNGSKLKPTLQSVGKDNNPMNSSSGGFFFGK